MSVRTLSRPLRLALQQRRALTSTRACLDNSEPTPSPFHSEGRRSGRALDVGKIWQAQGDSGAIATKDGSSRPYQILDKCPDPQCSCSPMPPMPEGLPIDMTSKMSMPYYDRHVLIGSRPKAKPHGSVHELAEEWPSKIESDPTHLATILKSHLGPKGQHYRPDFSVSITASTLADSIEDGDEDIWLFPDFVRLKKKKSPQPSSSSEAYSSALAAVISSSTPVQLQQPDGPPPAARWTISRITQPVILICGHGSRDERCGTMGRVLLPEFERHFQRASPAERPKVALVSHIGGHKFAGNVVVYMPPQPGQAPQFEGHYREDSDPDGSRSPLLLPPSRETAPIGGMGIWYGRVEPRHVEGIVEETVKGGRVIGEILRGVHDFGGAIWR